VELGVLDGRSNGSWSLFLLVDWHELPWTCPPTEGFGLKRTVGLVVALPWIVALLVAGSTDRAAVAASAERTEAEIPPLEFKAWGCKDDFLRSGASVHTSVAWHNQRIKKFPVRKRKTLTFMARTDGPGFSTAAYPSNSCDVAGNRSVDARVEMTDKKGVRRPFSRWVSMVKNSNDTIGTTPPPNEAYLKIPLRRPYTCLPGKPKRRLWVAFRLTSNYGPLPPEAAHLPSQKIIRQPDIGSVGSSSSIYHSTDIYKFKRC
jgi:hypothetical protein